MILYLGIVSILLMGIGAVSIAAIDAKSKAQAASGVFRAATDVFGAIERDIGRTHHIITPLAGVASSTLTLSLDQAESIKVSYIVAGGLLRTETGSLGMEVIAPDVKVNSLTFTALGSGVAGNAIRVNVTLSASSTGVMKQFQFSESFLTTLTLPIYR